MNDEQAEWAATALGALTTDAQARGFQISDLLRLLAGACGHIIAKGLKPEGRELALDAVSHYARDAMNHNIKNYSSDRH